jgi:cytochrome P450
MANPTYVGRHNPDYIFNYDPNEDAWSTDLSTLDMSRGERFRDDKIWPFFERLRKEDPVHYCPDSLNGPYWSITKYNDIMAIDTDHQRFSSEPSIVLFDPEEDFPLPMFIAMDPPSTTCSARRFRRSSRRTTLQTWSRSFANAPASFSTKRPATRRSTGSTRYRSS